jgi:hypothetical protein
MVSDPSPQEILCGKCRTAVEGPAEPAPDDVVTCPSCGRSARFDDAVAEASAYFESAMAEFEELLWNWKRRAADGKPVDEREYRFIVDLSG